MYQVEAVSNVTRLQPRRGGGRRLPGTRSLLDTRTAVLLAETFKALSDPSRVRIVSLLADSELRVCDLAAALGMSPSAVSHQLRTLRDLRLVRWRRAGREIYYALDDDHVSDLFQRGLAHIEHGAAT